MLTPHLSGNELHVILRMNGIKYIYTRKRKLRAEQVKHVINQFNKNYKHIFIAFISSNLNE